VNECPKCPWCGADGFVTGWSTRVKDCPYYEWRCGSWKKGVEPWQSDACRIYVLEGQVERLQAELGFAQQAVTELNRLIDSGYRRCPPVIVEIERQKELL
jgi:hypothetical protein